MYMAHCICGWSDGQWDWQWERAGRAVIDHVHLLLVQAQRDAQLTGYSDDDSGKQDAASDTKDGVEHVPFPPSWEV
jgi:hypothetical protein